MKIYEHLKNAIKLNSIPESSIENIQRDFINITCLLQTDGYDRFVFLHKSIQEFHAAKFVAALPYEHKVKFYDKVLDLIEIEDKYDNLLLFLKNLDRNNFERLLIINYFNKIRLNHLETERKQQVLEDLTKKIIKDKYIHLVIEHGIPPNEDTYSCVGVESSVVGDILPILNFFDVGERRNHSGKVASFIVSLFSSVEVPNNTHASYEPINIHVLKKMLIDEAATGFYPTHEAVGKINNGRICLYDYLLGIGAYDYISRLFREEVEGYYERIYKPISLKMEQVSKVLDIDFDI